MSELINIAAYGSVFLSVALIGGIACLGLNLQWGQTGLFNVGVAGFIGIGAYSSALLSTAQASGHWGGYHWPIAAGCLGGMLAAAAASALVGIMTLRLRSDYFAITTFGLAVVVQLMLRNAQSATGGAFGIGFIPRPFESLADRTVLFGLANLALIAALVKTQGPQRFSPEVLTNASGFSGIDGLFRFRADGTNERGLAVLRVAAAGPQTVAPAPRSFGGASGI